ncbi:hypothetical protein ACFLS1_00480 [Verrucomicrobiota bacterium]
MKLPTDKKERIKILILIFMGSALVLWLTITGPVNHYLRTKKERIEKIEKLNTDWKKARLEVSMISRDREETYDAVAKIKEASDKYVLLPRLGDNYLLGARDIVEKFTNELGLEIDSTKEIGRVDIPKGGGVNTFKAYTAQFDIQCGYHDLVKLLTKLEKSNPYACVSDLQITLQRNDRIKHHVNFKVQWPIWIDSEIPKKLPEQLAELVELRKKETKEK